MVGPGVGCGHRLIHRDHNLILGGRGTRPVVDRPPEAVDPENEARNRGRGRIRIAECSGSLHHRPCAHRRGHRRVGRENRRVERHAKRLIRAGIRRGDIVLAVNGQPVNSAEELLALAQQAGKRLALLIQRDGSTLFIPIQLE